MLQFSRTTGALLVEQGDELAHAMRQDDADAQYDTSFYVDWMKGSPQGTSLCSDVNFTFVPPPPYAIFQ
jgi:hypothetical protein